MQDELVMVSGMPILNGFNILTLSSPPHPFLLLLILKHFLRRHPFLCISWVLSSFYDYYWSITSSQSPLLKAFKPSLPRRPACVRDRPDGARPSCRYATHHHHHHHRHHHQQQHNPNPQPFRVCCLPDSAQAKC